MAAQKYGVIYTEKMLCTIKAEDWNKVALPGIRELNVQLNRIRLNIRESNTYEGNNSLSIIGSLHIGLHTDKAKGYNVAVGIVPFRL